MTVPSPAGYTEWGYLGAVVFLIVIFLIFIIRRDKEWRDFFTSIRSIDSQAVQQLTEAIKNLKTGVEAMGTRMESLEDEFHRHDATEMEFLRNMGAASATKPRNTQPRKLS